LEDWKEGRKGDLRKVGLDWPLFKVNKKAWVGLDWKGGFGYLGLEGKLGS